MKKLIIAVAALAIAVSFLPKVEAEDAGGGTATLGLTVTFELDQPPYWAEEPQDATVVAGETVVIYALAIDPDGDQLVYSCKWFLNGELQTGGEGYLLPEGAAFTWKVRPPDMPHLTWNVPQDIDLSDVHEFEFGAWGEGEQGISKKIRVTIELLQVISIELVDAEGQSNTEWALNDVQLGEEKTNWCPEGWMHNVKNTGTVRVTFDMVYAGDSIIGTGNLLPGPEQGVDTFVVKLGTEPILPHLPVHSVVDIPPGEKLALELTYGAPTELSGDVTGMGVVFEIRAYPPIER